MIRIEQGDGTLLKRSPPMIFPEMKLAHFYCKGEGLELGAAAHNPFNLPGCKNVAPDAPDLDHTHRKSFELFRDLQLEMCNAYALIDMVGVAVELPVPDRSQDYILSSHVVEHLPNVIGAFFEWKRVLRPGGIVFMIIPKGEVSDRGRPLTTIDHFVRDYESEYDLDTHPAPPGQHKESYHYHVFSLRSLLRLIDYCNRNLDLGWKIVAAEQTDSKVGNGHTVVVVNHGSNSQTKYRWPTTTFTFQLVRALVNGWRNG